MRVQWPPVGAFSVSLLIAALHSIIVIVVFALVVVIINACCCCRLSEGFSFQALCVKAFMPFVCCRCRCHSYHKLLAAACLRHHLLILPALDVCVRPCRFSCGKGSPTLTAI